MLKFVFSQRDFINLFLLKDTQGILKFEFFKIERGCDYFLPLIIVKIADSKKNVFKSKNKLLLNNKLNLCSQFFRIIWWGDQKYTSKNIYI